MWNLPGPGIKPALAGRFLTTGPPEKSSRMSFKVRQVPSCVVRDGVKAKDGGSKFTWVESGRGKDNR